MALATAARAPQAAAVRGEPRAYGRACAAEDTVLHRAVRSELATFLSALAESGSRPLPRYVLRAFDSFLRCGVFAHGFSRWHCDACKHDLLVAFSCHERCICPSCGVRRMDEVGAALVDRVLPDVPIRQWVLSLPWELRLLCARRADVMTAVVRAFWSALRTELVRRSGVPGSEPGAITFLQNFGGSLNLNLHLHVPATDGVFVPVGQGVRFLPLAPPTRAEVERVVVRARKSILRWLRRHGYLDEREPPSAQDDTPDSLRSCQQLALKYGELVALPSQSQLQSSERERRFEPKPSHSKHFRTEDGFDLDARVFIAEGDDVGRERLVRYCARPAIVLERLEKLPDGRYSYRTKYGRGDRTHRVMTGPELIARIAALVPSPRHPLLRYHGVFAPNHAWRRLVVPKPRRRRTKLVRVTARVPTEPEHAARDGEPSPECAHQEHDGGAIAPSVPAASGAPSDDDGHIEALYAAAPDAAAPDEPPPPALCSPFILTDDHLRRLLDGALLMTKPTASWAHLLRRSHDIDVLDCPKCHGRLRLMAVLRDQVQVRRFLRHLGEPTEPPPLAKARDPADDYAA